jgi:hypothetical protein
MDDVVVGRSPRYRMSKTARSTIAMIRRSRVRTVIPRLPRWGE